MQFLEKTDNLFDGQIFEHGKGREEMHRRMANASGEVHQLSWKIQLISRNPKITKYASDIAQKYDKLSDNDFVAEMVAKEDFSPAWEVVDQINSLTDQFLIEASRELKRWF